MATATSVGETAGAEPFLERLIGWIKAHRQATSYIAATLLIAGGLFWWNLLSTRRSEAIAGEQLDQARLAVESRNLPLAASELSRITANYAGTNAAEEGTVVLAQVRLLQGQSQRAIELLKDFAPKAKRAFQAQAYGLLGAAYENAGQPRAAAEAYEQGAHAARFGFWKGQLLSDAARNWLVAGDSARAIKTYRTIVTDLSESGPALEAKVRLGELTKGVGAP